MRGATQGKLRLDPISNALDKSRDPQEGVAVNDGSPAPLYRWGQLVVEYATVCFRSQENFEPELRRLRFDG